MMKKLFILILVSLSLNSYCQYGESAEVTLLKGVKLYGYLSVVNQDSFNLLVNDKLIGFNFKNVKKIKMLDKNSIAFSSTHLKNKFYYNTRLSSLINKNKTSFSITQSAYYHVMKNFLVGVGVGIENYLGSSNLNLMPVFLDSKFYFKSSSTSPFIGFRGGYASFISLGDTNINSNSRGGIQLNPVFGLSLFGSEMRTEIYGGLKFQKMYVEEEFSTSLHQTDYLARRLEFGLSFMF